jgi:hypoxia up-regulated 1
MAVDLGGEYIKVAVVKAGRTPISIVPNEMSKRRTAAQVAFVGGERLLGEEAAALGARFPDSVYARCCLFFIPLMPPMLEPLHAASIPGTHCPRRCMQGARPAGQAGGARVGGRAAARQVPALRRRGGARARHCGRAHAGG